MANDERVARIERAAVLLYGADADGKPRAGWMSAMARDLDVRPSTITETVKLDQPWSVFDRRLGDKILDVLIKRKQIEVSELRILAEELKTKPRETTVYGLDELNELAQQTGTTFTTKAEFEARKKAQKREKGDAE